MKEKIEKYLVYIHQDYFNRLCNVRGATTCEECGALRNEVYRRINEFLQGETGDVALFDQFIDEFGNERKSIEIYRLSDFARVKNLQELKRLRDKQKSNGFVELNKE